MTKIELIAALCDCMNTAVNTGDWRVDGTDDPQLYIDMAEARLEQEGWHKDGINGGEWVED